MSNIPFLFGFIAAVAHVLSGPDHLSAVAPLALRSKFRSWLIGMSWGLGHLLGMLVLGVLFFFFRDLLPVEFISSNSERIVGLMLIAIGLWSLARLVKHNWRSSHSHVHTHLDESGNAVIHHHGHSHGSTNKHEHKHDALGKQTFLAALGIGIIHGLAGFSHIFNLLPTLAFASNYQAGLYLFGFGGGTIFAMAMFSFLLGMIAHAASQKKKETIYRAVNAVAGFAAIFVGFYWLWSTW